MTLPPSRPNPKIIFCGSPAVGKTTIFHRILSRETSVPSATLGAAFGVAQTVVNGQAVSLNLWDTAGQEEYRSLVTLYFKSAAVAVIVFDLTSPDSFTAVLKWHEDVLNNCGEAFPQIVVVGNKLDLRDCRAISEDQIDELVSKLHCEYFEVSALDGTNVGSMFRGAALVAVQKDSGGNGPELATEGKSCC